MKRLLPALVALVLIAAAALWWFNRHAAAPGASADSPLAFAPADTAFVFGNLEPLPEDVVEQMLAQSGKVIGLYEPMMESIRAGIAKDESDAGKKMLVLFDALAAEFKGKSPQQINDTLGIGLRARAAFYAVGATPVLRLELAEPDHLRAFIGRMEAAAGMPIPREKLGELEYWRIGETDAPVRGIAAIIGQHLVISIAGPKHDDSDLRIVLGLERPARSVLSEHRLEALNREYGFVEFGSGYIDTQRVVQVVSAVLQGSEEALLSALKIEADPLDEVCAQEYAALAASWPRVVMGYTRWDTGGNEVHAILETRPDIASQLMKLRAPMPGTRVARDTLMNFGVSFKLAALPEVVNSFASAVKNAPWQCESLAELNMAFEQAKQGVNNPGLYAAAPVFSGFHAIVDALDIDMKDPTAGMGTSSGTLLLGSDNPQSLVAMAASVAPALAKFQLADDGSVQPLPAVTGVPAGVELFAARRDKVLGLGVGSASQRALADRLSSDADQQPLLLIGVSARFYTLIADAMEHSAESESTPEAKQLLKQQADLMRGMYSSMFKRTEMRLELTGHGIEWQQRVEMP